MNRKSGALILLLISGLIGAMLISRKDTLLKIRKLNDVVQEKGTPDFLANEVAVEEGEAHVLQLLVPAINPKKVSDWNKVTNVWAIWVGSDVAQRNAGYFYKDIETGKSLAGRAWYSTRSFFGEKIILVKVDRGGNVKGLKTFRVGNISTRMDGFVRSNSVPIH